MEKNTETKKLLFLRFWFSTPFPLYIYIERNLQGVEKAPPGNLLY